ncbi:MAG TPA: 3-phosphoshikimate 1-carboxyvinyltransferase [Acidimicrobiales bacterium]|nr:3-phosphoshikimate 1-carboxyvinyltransferase [Acidimicrobiales bacterium]
MRSLAVQPLTGPLDATVVVPGSKSITNRALVAAALAQGTSVLSGALHADDTEALVDSLQRLGVGVVRHEGSGDLRVAGTGGHLPPGPADLDARLSGTTARFLLPLLALGHGTYRLDGGVPLRARPMGPLVDAVRRLGADIDEERPGHLPVVVRGRGLQGGRVRLPGSVSSQFVSGLLLSGPAMAGGLEVDLEPPVVSRPYLALTARTMADFGAEVTGSADDGWQVAPGHYTGRSLEVEPDASAASYFFAAAAICGGRVRVPGLGVASAQGDLAFLDVLAAMGAEVHREPDAVEVVGTGTLEGVDVDLADCSDTAQTLAAVAVFAASPTRVRGIGFIRRKETDRVAAVVTELRRCGIDAEEQDDGFVVHPGRPRPARIRTYHDHRMAMSFTLLGLRAPGIEIADPGCVAKTFPGFFRVVDGLRTGQGQGR